MSSTDRTPLGGVRVVELAHNLAGPFAGQILADLGAEVIKVERPGVGDPARAWGPPFCGGDGTIFAAANRGKRGVALDLTRDVDSERFQELVADSDVLIESLRPGSLERLGFGWDRLRELNPRLLYGSVRAYGDEGPLRDQPGYDLLMQAHAGLMAVTGPKDGAPVRVGTSVVDFGTGMWLALAVLAGLRERDRTGRGMRIGASLFETALVWSSYHILGYVSDGAVPRPFGTELPMIAPYGAWPTADGQLLVAAGNDNLFRRACEALGLGDLADDPRFASNPARVENRTHVNARIAEATRRFTTRELLNRLRDAGVPAAPLLGIDEVASDPQTRASELIVDLDEASGGYPSVALPLRWDGARVPIGRRPPRIGEHTDEVFSSPRPPAREPRDSENHRTP